MLKFATNSFCVNRESAKKDKFIKIWQSKVKKKNVFYTKTIDKAKDKIRVPNLHDDEK